MFNNELWQKPTSGAAGGGFYSHQIANSVRWDSGYLKWTPGSAGNRQVWTFSCWVKKAIQPGNTDVMLLNAGTSGNQDTRFRAYWYGDNLRSSSANANYNVSSGVYRDPSAWMHIVWKLTGGTSYQYVNGVEVSTSSVSGDVAINNNVEHTLGIAGDYGTGGRFKGCIAEVVFIDGTALDPTSFASEKNGVWIPDAVSGLTFGSQGYYLKFESSSDLGNDSSGNNNDWTVVDLAAHDQMTDTPTFNSDSNGGNFATMNPLSNGSNPVLAEGNLMMDSFSGSDISGSLANFALPPSSGKWYFECFINSPNSGDNYPFIGLTATNYSQSATMGVSQRDLSINLGTGGSEKNETYVGSITTDFTGVSNYADNTICGVFVDMDARKLWYAKDGAFTNSGNPQDGTNPNYAWTNNVPLLPHFVSFSGYGADSVLNFGQDGTFAGNVTAGGNSDVTGYGNFKYDPGDYKALCSGNLPLAEEIDPAQTDTGYPQKQFNALLYTGDGGSSRAITGLGFQPDWIWIKRRNATENHNMYDAVRGANKRIQPNRDVVESTEGLPAIGSDGFTVDASGGICNVSSQTYVAWNAKADGSGSSNSDGGTTSTVSANTAIGFSIVQYAGTGGGQTIGHGLDKAPEFMSCKPTAGYAYQWVAYHKNGNDGATGQNGYLAWQTTSGFNSLSSIWNNTAPTSTVFSTGGSQNTGGSSGTYINYCWHSVEGVTKVGMYVGNGSTDGPFVYTGFKPAFIIIKGLASGAGWNLHDNKTSPFNVADTVLQSNTSSAELSNYNIDMVSNGFKIRDSDGDLGTNGNKYIYIAMAEQSFKYATAR